MADAVELDLYADDLDQDFTQNDFNNDGIDLYDDVVCSEGASRPKPENNSVTTPGNTAPSNATPAANHTSGQFPSTHTGRRYQLYVGNLTWWTTDQDITDAIVGLGIQDFIEVKFFEHRSNGRSKGFCLVSLGSEQSMRSCMERLPKKELHGQNPVVTYATKQAFTQFESQTEARPSGIVNNQGGIRPQMPQQQQGPRMMRNPGQIRNQTPNSGMQHIPPRMPGGPPMAGPPPHPGQQHPFPNSWQNGMRQNGPMRPPGPPQPMPQQRPLGPPPGMFQGPPPPGQVPPRGPPPGMPVDQRGPMPRPDWNRPPGMQGFMPPPHQQMLTGPPNRPPPPPNLSGPVPQAGAMNTGYFPPGGPVMQPPQVPPQGPPPVIDYAPPMQQRMHSFPTSMPTQEHRTETPALSETEFEEIMSRNRSVSSSAIARAISDAAAGEYSSAIETLVTAISLIKQSKAANDDRCKILISSLQDTLHGIESKSFGAIRRERSRSRDRAQRRPRRERSRSREREYRERSRDRDRDREKEARYYSESYGKAERSRSRDRERDREREREYRELSKDDRYYEERYRERERDRDRDRERERDRDTTRREPERERERDRERERERGESSHRSSRH